MEEDLLEKAHYDPMVQDILEKKAIPAGDRERISQLTAYFAFNKERKEKNLTPMGLTYPTAFKKLRYDIRTKSWQLYKVGAREGKMLCRLKGVSPTNYELLVIIFFVILIYFLGNTIVIIRCERSLWLGRFTNI